MTSTARGVEAAASLSVTFHIPAMDCHVEEDLIRSHLEKLPEILNLQFDLAKRDLKVEYMPPISAARIEAILQSIGTPCVRETPPQKTSRLNPLWTRLIIGCILGALSELMELGNHMYPDYANSMTVLSCLFAIGAILATGLGTFKKGWRALLSGTLNINALMAVAVTGAVCIGQFPEAAMVMVLFEISEALEHRAMNKARMAIKDLLDLSPQKVTVLNANGDWREENVAEIEIGDIIRVRPGEKVGMDGTVIKGNSSINQAPITGESMPVEKKPGDKVYAGTINEWGEFEFRATAKSGDTTLARIIKAVEEAQTTKAPVERLVDKFARYYTPVIFLLSIVAFIISLTLLDHPLRESIYAALVILVIGCPCALVISTPVSIVSALSRAASQGILIKGGVFLEEGRNLDAIALDKTGTITLGKPEVGDMRVAEGQDANAALALAASLASRSDHPVSQAIAQYGGAKEAAIFPVKDFKAIPGKGVEGIIDDRSCRLGNVGLFGAEEKGQLAQDAKALEKEGNTIVILGDPAPIALFAVADSIKPSSLEALARLKEMGIKTILLTGDNAVTAAKVAKEAGVGEYRGNLLPNDKKGFIDKLRDQGDVVGMVGDGINDAPALASADIGFAMGGAGSDTAIETADVALMDDDLRKIPRFIRLSRHTWVIVAENIVFALGVKALVFILALLGQATMWMAVMADVCTTLCVVANGMRLLRK